MNDRERFLACVAGEPVDRPPFWLHWGPWGRAWQRWLEEGKPDHVVDHRSFMAPDNLPFVVPVNCGPCPKDLAQVIEEDEDYFVHYDSWGIKRRDYKHGESMSEFLEFPVKDRDDWETYKATHLDPDHPERLAGEWEQVTRDALEQHHPIQLGYFPDVGIFGGLRWLMGDEECLVAFYTQPELVHDIMEHLTTLYLHVFSQVTAKVTVDIIHIWEDMCGVSGPLIGPNLYAEFMTPCYLRIKEFARQHEIPVLSVDTDGDPHPIIPEMLRAGVNYLFPNEVAAGCDVNAYRKEFPELALMGGIDKRALAVSPEAIDAELERIRPALALGRFIPDLDHLIPDDVSWSNYEYYARRLKEMVVG